jgi:hypothetical protein
VSQVAFGNSAQSASLDGNAVDAVHADLTAAHLEGGFDMTTSARLPSNASASFIGTQKNGPFDIDGPKARAWLRAPNPHGISNFEVVRPWVSGQDMTRRPSDRWIVDFDKRTQDDSALSKSHSPMQMSLCAQLGLTCAEIGIARIGGFMVIRGRH